MKRPLKRFVLSALAVVLVVALWGTIEWNRRRNLRSLAAELGGTFEAGGLLDDLPMPEAEGFDLPIVSRTITYSKVIRLERGGVRYAAAFYHRSPETKQSKGTSYVVVFVTLPESSFPAFDVIPPTTQVNRLRNSTLGVEEWFTPVPLAIGSDRFKQAFVIHPAMGAPRPDKSAVDRFLPPAVQERLAGSREFLFGVQVRGNAIRFQARSFSYRHPYREMLTLAENVAEDVRREPSGE